MQRLAHTTTLATLTLAAAILAACGGSGGYGNGPTGPTTGSTGGTATGGTTSTTNAIAVADNSFTPSATTVARGTTVTWTWGGRVQHNVTFDDGTASATQTSGTFARAFSVAGTYPYHCTIHGTAMAGTVTVQ